MSVLDSIAQISLEVDKPGRMILKGLNGQALRGPDGSVTYIDLYSADSAAGRKHDAAVARKRLAMRGRMKVTPEELEAERVDLLVALTAGAGTILSDETVQPDTAFDREKFRSLYANGDNAEFRSQVEDFVGDRANFSKASSTS